MNEVEKIVAFLKMATKRRLRKALLEAMRAVEAKEGA